MRQSPGEGVVVDLFHRVAVASAVDLDEARSGGCVGEAFERQAADADVGFPGLDERLGGVGWVEASAALVDRAPVIAVRR